MTSEREKAFVTFTGNAKATSEEIIVQADTIDVFLFTQDEKKSRSGKNNNNTNQNIKEIIATGNVRFTSNEHKAFADRAVYTTTTEQLVLTGNAPRVTTGKSYVTGKKITLFQKNGKVVVESGTNQRVEAMFNNPDSKADTEPDTNKDKEVE